MGVSGVGQRDGSSRATDWASWKRSKTGRRRVNKWSVTGQTPLCALVLRAGHARARHVSGRPGDLALQLESDSQRRAVWKEEGWIELAPS